MKITSKVCFLVGNSYRLESLVIRRTLLVFTGHSPLDHIVNTRNIACSKKLFVAINADPWLRQISAFYLRVRLKMLPNNCLNAVLYAIFVTQLACAPRALAGEVCNPSPINLNSFDNVQCYEVQTIQEGKSYYSKLAPFPVDNTPPNQDALNGQGNAVLIDGQAVAPTSGGFWTGASSVVKDGAVSNTVRDNSGNVYGSSKPIQ